MMNRSLSFPLSSFAKLIVLAVAVVFLVSTNGFSQDNVAEGSSGKEKGEEQTESAGEENVESAGEGVESEPDPVEQVGDAGRDSNVAESPPVIAVPDIEDGSNPDRSGVLPGPPTATREGGLELTPEQRRRLGLPGFAEDQPGFIPDMAPTDLFADDNGDRNFYFDTMLGRPKVPGGNARSLIDRYETSPQKDLDNNQVRIVVPGGDIVGSTESKKFQITGGLTIYYSDVSITADAADIDEKNDLAVLHGNVNIVDPKYRLATDELRLYFEDKRFIAIGFVQFKKDESGATGEPRPDLDKKDRLRESIASEQFELYCKDLYYNWETLEMTAIGGVRLVHPSFNGTMDRIDYNDETKEYQMSGSINLNVSDYNWIFDNNLVEEDDSEKVRAITDNETSIICDRIEYSEESGVAKFYARIGRTVKFDQDVRSIEAPYIEVNDETKDLFAEGSENKQVIYQQRDGEWLFVGGIVNRDEASDDLKDVFSEPLTVTSDVFLYNFDRKRLELTGQVKMTGTGKSLSAGYVVQDETAKYFLIRENVYLKPDDSSEIRAAQVYIDTASDRFTFVGLVEGQLESEDLAVQRDDEAGSGQEIQVQQGLFESQGVPGRSSTGQGSGGGDNRAER